MKPLNKLLPHLAAISLFMLLLAISIFGADREATAHDQALEPVLQDDSPGR